jgi:hypothetical protein
MTETETAAGCDARELAMLRRDEAWEAMDDAPAASDEAAPGGEPPATIDDTWPANEEAPAARYETPAREGAAAATDEASLAYDETPAAMVDTWADTEMPYVEGTADPTGTSDMVPFGPPTIEALNVTVLTAEGPLVVSVDMETGTGTTSGVVEIPTVIDRLPTGIVTGTGTLIVGVDGNVGNVRIVEVDEPGPPVPVNNRLASLSAGRGLTTTVEGINEIPV